MKKESIEDLRSRLMRDESLQERIRIRAFQIYQSRGGQPGNPQLDWLEAEYETLTQLIEQEYRLASLNEGGSSVESIAADPPAAAVKARAPKRTTAARKTTKKATKREEPTQGSAKKKPSRTRKPESKTK
jgi:hypothetical protein